MARYAIAPVVVFLGLFVAVLLTSTFGNLPLYVTFYPAVMIAALAGGFGPGLLATFLSALATAYWVLPPAGQFKVEHPDDLAALVLFCIMGLFMSVVAHRYQRTHKRAARFEQELAVRASEMRLHIALRAANAGAWEWEVRTGKASWSEEMWDLFELDPGHREASFEAWLDSIVPDDRDRVEKLAEEATRQQATFAAEWRVKRRDGGERWLLSRGQPERDPDGSVMRYIGIVLDITARKHAEAELRDADKHKNQFLAMLSHELRNPLAPIRNSLYILDHAPAGGEQALRAQAVIDRQIGQLTRLIDDLLDVTRISRGKIQLQRERLDLGEVAQRCVDDHRSVFTRKDVQLELRPAPGPVWVNGDRVRLAQVIGNLLQNSAKFTPPAGTTTLSVETDPAHQQAILIVRDTGTGIAPEIMPWLFTPFTQAEMTLDRSKGGLGLGLALVKGLVEMHGGTVRGESEGTGKGTTFTIRLPLDTQVAVPATAERRRQRGDGGRRRVLVIEDNVDAADSLCVALELDNYVVETAYDGVEGLAKAKASHPDIVMCDIGLPKMDGYEVARALRADPELGRVTLVALTGYAGPEDMAKAKAAGFDRHLAKPATMEAVQRALETVP